MDNRAIEEAEALARKILYAYFCEADVELLIQCADWRAKISPCQGQKSTHTAVFGAFWTQTRDIFVAKTRAVIYSAPMNAIIGMSTIGRMKLTDLERVRDCFQKIDASSRYLLSLINDILRYVEN